MRTCSKCKLDKPLDEFHFKNRDKGIRHSYCSVCHSAYVKSHYQSNLTYYKDKARRRNDRLKEDYRRWLVDYFIEHPCVDCGETDIILLEFDHIAGEKKNAVSSMVRMGYTPNTLREEIDKCVVRCVACHRRKTALERHWWNISKE